MNILILIQGYIDYNSKIDLEKINTDFNFIIQKINEYNLELKTNIIELLNRKISEIERIYKQIVINNIKLQNIIKTLISNYKSNENNSSNIKKIFYLTHFLILVIKTKHILNLIFKIESLVNNASII